MAFLECPGCHGPVAVAALDPGHEALCPSCAMISSLSAGVLQPLGDSGQTGAASPRAPVMGQDAGSASSSADTGDGLDGQARKARPSSEDPIPTIPGYSLEYEIGRGGMGVVYAATQLTLQRRVAIKMLSPELSAHPTLVQRFDKEALVLAKLAHPNIVQIIDKAVVGGAYYFVMEFVAGTSLRKRIPPRGLPPAEAFPIFEQVCDALEFIHGEGVIHRDVKPENIFLSDRGGVKLGDFGLVGLLEEDTLKEHLTGKSSAMGTALYMAPEQRTDARSVDQRADIYSLGVTFYEMLTGQVPSLKYLSASQLAAGLDPLVDRIIDHALEAAPSARYSSVREMLGDLQNVRHGSARGRIAAARPSVDQREQETWAHFVERSEKARPQTEERPARKLGTAAAEQRLKATWESERAHRAQVAPNPGPSQSAEAIAEARLQGAFKKERGKTSKNVPAAGSTLTTTPESPTASGAAKWLVLLGLLVLLGAGWAFL